MKIYLVFSMFIFISCLRVNEVKIDKNTFGPPFLTAAKYYNITNQKKWRLDVSFVEKNIKLYDTTNDLYLGGFYYYKKKVKDTLYFLSIEYYSSKRDTFFIPNEFYKRYENDAFQHVILFGKNGDTLFHYKADLFRSLKKVFISGMYYYQVFFSGGLNDKQMDYFLMHQDSLTHVKGANLPKLPEYP